MKDNHRSRSRARAEARGLAATIGADQPSSPAESLEDLAAFLQSVAANVSLYARSQAERFKEFSLEDEEHRRVKSMIAQATAANYYKAARICAEVAEERKG